MNLSKTEAKNICLEFSLLEGSRIDMIEKIACTLLEQGVNYDDGLLLLVEGKGKGKGIMMGMMRSIAQSHL